jgi:hypothetical protein
VIERWTTRPCSEQNAASRRAMRARSAETPGTVAKSLQAQAACTDGSRNRRKPMKNRRITLASVDRMQSTVDAAARLHRIGLLLFVAACVSITLPRAGLPAWMPLAGMAATALAFVLKAAGTVHEIRLADTLARVMGMPYRRGFTARGLDHNAWSAIRSYVLVSAVLTVAVALTPSMLASVGETAYANLTVAVSMAALAIQSFDNPRRLRHRVMQICSGRMELHASDDDVLMA